MYRGHLCYIYALILCSWSKFYVPLKNQLNFFLQELDSKNKGKTHRLNSSQLNSISVYSKVCIVLVMLWQLKCEVWFVEHLVSIQIMSGDGTISEAWHLLTSVCHMCQPWPVAPPGVCLTLCQCQWTLTIHMDQLNLCSDESQEPPARTIVSQIGCYAWPAIAPPLPIAM